MIEANTTDLTAGGSRSGRQDTPVYFEMAKEETCRFTAVMDVWRELSVPLAGPRLWQLRLAA